MNISTAANYAEIAGGFAVLVSLIYVGYQIRQSNRIASASALQSVLDRFSDRNISQYLEHPEIEQVMHRGHQCFNDLTILEGELFSACILREVFHMQNVMQLHKRGLLDTVDYETWLAYTAAHIKTPGGQETWKRLKVSITPTIVKTIEAFLEANPSSPSLIELYPHAYQAHVAPEASVE